jgi:hypothetical protein
MSGKYIQTIGRNSIAPIFRAEDGGCRFLPFSTLKMEALNSSESFVTIFKTTYSTETMP